MTYPVYIGFGALKIHPHLLFEALAYFIGFRVYLLTRNKGRIPVDTAITVIVGATIGAALGSKLLYWFEDPFLTVSHWNDLVYLLGGKTIVGGLLGGLIGVELAKKLVGWTRSTGDDFAIPLIVGMSIGRIGCFLTGLDDHTYGSPTQWITGVDFGDGIPRHPAQLYEIVFLCLLAAMIIMIKRGTQSGIRAARYRWPLIPRFVPDGALFQVFMIGYLLFRLFIDFMKPTIHPYLGLNNVQVACLLGLIYYAWLVSRWPKQKATQEGEMIHA